MIVNIKMGKNEILDFSAQIFVHASKRIYEKK
jgi:hypothetical protein